MNEFAAIRQDLLRLKSLVAAERFRRALYRHYLALKAGYRPDQPRDDLGKWTDEGGSSRPARVRLASSEKPRLGPKLPIIAAVELAQRLIAAFRSENGLPDLFGRWSSTLTVTTIDGKSIFGSNSSFQSYTDADYREAVRLRDSMIAKYPDIMKTEDIGQKPNDALFHAEANILMRAAKESGGSLSGRSLEIFADRELCLSCRAVLPSVGLELGNPTVTFIGPRGQRRTMRDGIWID